MRFSCSLPLDSISTCFSINSVNQLSFYLPFINGRPAEELLAIMYAINKWSNTLKGNKFVVETDHKALCYLHSSSKYMILDWLDTILSFDFTVTYKKGIENILPDALLTRDRDFSGCSGRGFRSLNN